MCARVCVCTALALIQPTDCGEKSCREKVVWGGGGLSHLSPSRTQHMHTHTRAHTGLLIYLKGSFVAKLAPVFIYYPVISLRLKCDVRKCYFSI